MLPLAPPLLELARSIAPDEGALVVRSLRAILREASPFDAGEVALATPEKLLRLSLDPGGSPLASDELIAHVSALGEPLRLDDLSGRAPVAGHLLQSGYRSLLALPLASAGGPAGAVVLVRRFGWGFVAAPLRDLTALVGMAGLCLERSFWLSALAQHGRDLHASGIPWKAGSPQLPASPAVSLASDAAPASDVPPAPHVPAAPDVPPASAVETPASAEPEPVSTTAPGSDVGPQGEVTTLALAPEPDGDNSLRLVPAPGPGKGNGRSRRSRRRGSAGPSPS